MSTLTVSSGYPSLPFFVVGHGIDSNTSVTIGSGSAALVAGTVLRASGSAGKYYARVDSTSAAAGILYRDADPSDGDVLAAMFIHGVVRSGSLTPAAGTDSLDTAITSLSDQIQFV